MRRSHGEHHDSQPGRPHQGALAHPRRTSLKWVADQPSGSLFTTSIAQAEILYGI
jgi:hypothetical protein